MACDVSREQLWSWVDRDAPELEAHVRACPRCRARAEEIRAQIGSIALDPLSLEIRLPEKIGPYPIRRLIGEGGQAFVYEAEQPSPRRLVALKVLKGGPLIGRRDRRRFRQEIQALASLRHPLIAAIYEAGQTPEGSPYLVMELVKGTPLHLWWEARDVSAGARTGSVGGSCAGLDESGGSERERIAALRERVALFVRICGAVQYAHRQGVIHRDLKPANILVDEEGTPRILDFGLARLAKPEAEASLTDTHRLEGTPRYLSPERITGRPGEVDARADVYSLGVMLYEALAGRAPHDISSMDPESLRSICQDPPPRPSTFEPLLRGDLEAILLRALEKDPDQRYPSAEALAADLSLYLAGEPVTVRPTPLLRRARRVFRRHRAAAVAVAAALLVAAVAGHWFERSRTERMRAREELIDAYGRLLRSPPDALQVKRVLALAERVPESPDVVLVRAQAEARDREFRYAIELLQTQLSRSPGEWSYRQLLAEILRQTGRASEARRESTLIPTVVPDGARAWYFRSLATLDGRRGLESAQEAVGREPDHPLYLRNCYGQAMALGAEGIAADCAGRLARVGPSWAYWTGERAAALVRVTRYDEAIQAVDSLLAATPGDRALHHLRGGTMRFLGRHREAAESYTRAIDTAGTEAEAAWDLYHRATVLWMLERPREAVDDFRRVHRILAYTSYANARLVLCLRDLGRVDEADTALEEARAGLLQNNWLGSILDCLAGQIAPAQLIAQADSSAPTQICEARYYAAEMARASGRREDARQWFEECVSLGLVRDPDNPMEPMSETELAAWRLGQAW